MSRRLATPVEPAAETGFRDPELSYDYQTYQNIPNFDCKSMGEYHDKCGKFKKGNPGGPGRPRKKKPELQHIENDYVTRVANRVPPERLDPIIDKALEQADNGDRFARAWLTQMLMLTGKLVEIAAADQAGLDSEDIITQKRRELHPGTDLTEPMPQELVPVETPKCLKPLLDRVAEEVKPDVTQPGYVPVILPPFAEYPELNQTFPAFRTPPYTGENVTLPQPCDSIYGFAVDPHAPEELVPELTKAAEELSASTEPLPHQPAPPGLIKIVPASAPSDLPERLTSRMMLPTHSPRALPPPPPGVVFPYETCHCGPICFGPDRPMLEIPGYGRVDARWIQMTQLEREGRLPERTTVWWGIMYDEQGFWPIPFGQEGRLRKERLKGTDFGDLAMREIGRGPNGERLTPAELAKQRAENLARQGYGPDGQKLEEWTEAEALNPLRPGGARGGEGTRG
jgi:hypothetical protein